MGTGIALCLYVFIGMALLGRGLCARNAQEQELQKARVAFGAALARLKRQPADVHARQLALDAGRHYSKLTHECTGVFVVDAVALKRELDAAISGTKPRS